MIATIIVLARTVFVRAMIGVAGLAGLMSWMLVGCTLVNPAYDDSTDDGGSHTTGSTGSSDPNTPVAADTTAGPSRSTAYGGSTTMGVVASSGSGGWPVTSGIPITSGPDETTSTTGPDGTTTSPTGSGGSDTGIALDLGVLVDMGVLFDVGRERDDDD